MEDTGVDQEAVGRAAACLADREHWLVITGAGLSADSGLPTYRGVGGLYDAAETEEGIPIEVVLSGPMLRARPELSWKYLRQIGDAVFGGSPNEGHRALARLEAGRRITVLTQNVDGYHVAAGSSDVIAIHGDCHDLRCDACGERWRIEDYAALPTPPPCRACDGAARPDVVLFGEMLPAHALARLAEAVRGTVDAVLSVGTSSLFPYIAGPVLDAAARGLPTVEVNPSDTDVSSAVDVRLASRAAATLVALEEALS